MTGNDLSGNSNKNVVAHSTGPVFNASANWHGSAVLATVQGRITGNSVDYTPYLNIGTDTAGTVGFQGDFSSLTVHASGNQFGVTPRIQEGIGLVTSGGTVKVLPGTYTGDVDATSKSVALAAGASPGQVTINGNFTLTSDDTLPIEVDGTSAATQYDNFVINGSLVSLGNATLVVSGTYTPAAADSFTIITNDAGDAVVGIFNGLPEGTLVNVNGTNKKISYVGGDGNDVVLAALSADLSVTKTDSPDPVTEGNLLTYTLTVSNAGPDDATNVVLTDTLPGSVTFVSATPSQGAPCTGTTTITCNLGAISNGNNATVQIVVIPNTPGSITNNATATAFENDGTPATDSENTSVSAAVCTTPAPGMVGWWPGDGNANDIQGPTFENGTLQGGATFDAGKVNQAFKFDGVDDYVSQPLPANVQSQTITVDAWVNLNTLAGDNVYGHTVVAAEPGGTNTLGLGVILAVNTSGTARFTKGSGSGYQSVGGTTVLSPGVWYHLAGTYDGATMKIYVNGVEEGSLANAAGISWTDFGGQFPNPAQLYFGAFKDSVGGAPTVPQHGFLNGRIDEIEIFTSALSGPDIAAIYNASFAGKCRTCTTPPTDMEAWLPAEGNANDIAGPNNGTFAANTYAAGKVGQAFSFDGVNDNVSLPNLVYGPSFSVDAWIKTSTVPSGLGTIVDEIGASTNEGFQCQVSDEPGHIGQVRFYLSDDTNTVTTYSTALVNDGVFHHVACVKNGNTAEVYVDGVLSGTGNVSSITGNYDSVTGVTSIGAARNGAGQFFQGLIDEVEIFNRALSATEVAAIANAGNAGKCHTSTVQFAQANTNDTETNAGSHTVDIVVTRDGASDSAVDVTYTVTDGSAETGDSDYLISPATGTLHWNAGDSTPKNITITVNGDTKFEPDETVNLSLSNAVSTPPGFVTLGAQSTATLTILNDDTQPTISIDNVTLSEGNAGITAFNFTVSLSNASYQTITVNAQTADDTATTADLDYTGVSSMTLTFNPNQTSQQFQVLVNGDTKFELNDQFFVDLSGATNASILDNQGVGTITNDDPQPSISINSIAQAEGDSSQANLTFTVTLSNPSYQTITVNYATANGVTNPATGAAACGAGIDYVTTSGGLTFNPGETSKPVDVPVCGDTVYELNETFTVTLDTPANSTIGTGTGTGTINNDDAAPTITINDRTLNEGTNTVPVPITTFTFTLTKTGDTDVAATVNWATANGTTNPATGGAACGGAIDYVTNSGLVTFPASGPGSTTQTVTVNVCREATFEPNETFFVNLSGETHSTLTDNQGLGTIVNDDSPGSALVVNTTDDVNDGVCDGTHCSLREAINAANTSPSAITINFGIPASDSRHFYYADDNGGSPGTANGTVTLANVTATTATDDTTIVGIDPDWTHSWWSIVPASALPTITPQTVVVNGYSQCPNPTQCAQVNTATGSTNAVLRIELIGNGQLNSGLSVAGGSSSVSGLVVNRFELNGINLSGAGKTITGSFIGTDVSGTLDLGNGGSGGSGVVSSASNSTIGGNSPDAVNLISGNDGHGIVFSNSNSSFAFGNLIGTRANGTVGLGNGGSGINLTGAGSAFNTIGGTTTGEGNTIAFNGADGISLPDSLTGNSIRGNSIYSNGATAAHLGIDLGTDGVTANDPLDPDSGPNDSQNFPIIRTALAGTPNRIRGTLNSEANQTYTIDLYSNTACDTSGNGEGKTYLGSTTADTDANGDALWSINPTVLNAGEFITATATDSSGNTSEFSACFQATGLNTGTAQFVGAPYTDSETNADHTVTITVSRTGGSNLAMDVTYQTSNGSATLADNDYVAASGTLHWDNGETGDKTFTITVKGDTIFEGDETVNITLSGAPISGANPTTLTITNDDPQPALSINDVTLAEGNAGTTNFIFTVTKTNHGAVSVNYQTQNGTATLANNDYQSTSGTLNWSALDTTPQTITVLGQRRHRARAD